MKRTKVLQEIRRMRFQEAYGAWSEGRLSQEEAAQLLGVCARTFRRYIDRYEEEGLQGLIDKRLEQVSHRRAPLDEVMAVVQRYQSRHSGWNVKHFHTWYRREGGSRSYTWVKNRLQDAGVVSRSKARGPHRRRREPAPWAGMLLHQDGSTHEWVAQRHWDLIVTMDDATNEHYSMFFVEEEGTASSLRGVREVIESRGLFCSLYTDRGSHYWHTPEAGGKVDRRHLTQFGRAMQQLGVEMIAAYSPEARGRSERMFRTHQDRLTKELAAAGIRGMAEANRYVKEVYLPAFNAEFSHPAREEGTGFVPYVGRGIEEILCEHFERVVGRDNCVEFERLKLQIPTTRGRSHYMKAKVRVHRYNDGSLAVFHGHRCLGRYDTKGRLKGEEGKVAA
jgi:transposase